MDRGKLTSRHRSTIMRAGTAFLACGISLYPLAVRGDGIEIKMLKGAKSEAHERNVDTAAWASQQKAIAKLTGLLKKYTNTRQEPILLSKLGELQLENSSIVFRLAHGMAHRNQKSLDFSSYNKALKEAAVTLSTLISKYPSYSEIEHAYYYRGKAFEDMGSKPQATKDYLYLVKNFPNAEEAALAYMSLAEFSIEANDHLKAIGYLKEVEKHPENPRFPFALYKMAWSYYNLKNIPVALSYAERHLAYFSDRKSGRNGGQSPSDDTLVSSDGALKENTLMDIAVFYFEGFEEKIPEYSSSNALDYFRKQEKGPLLGKMMVRFAKLLRSHGHEAELMGWKDQVMLTESNRPEALDVLVVTYENQLNKRRYSQLVDTSQDMVKLYQKHRKYEGFPKAQKMILDTANEMQQIMVKNKDADEIRAFSRTLAALYDAFVKMVPENDPRIPRVHYNLAETLFAIRDYSAATQNYRWVVEHGQWKKTVEMEDASLKAIASRYEVLHQNGSIPKTLSPKSLKDDKTEALDPLVAEWLEWLDTHQSKSKKDVGNFVFEAGRALYAQNHIRESLEILKRFAVKNPRSQYAIASASLILDTYIASADWDKTHDLATDFMDVTEWKGSEFSKRLYSVAADAFYKKIEVLSRENDYGGVLKYSDQFLKKYAGSARVSDTLALAGNAALTNNEKSRALAYYSMLIHGGSKSDSVGHALLIKAGLEEDKYLFLAASQDYLAFFNFIAANPKSNTLSDGKLNDLRKKILHLAWLTGDAAELKAVLNNKTVCTEKLADDCEKFTVVGALAAHQTDGAFEKARKTEGETRALYAALALEDVKSLPFRDRLLMVRHFMSGWDGLDPLQKYTLIPYISVSIPKAFDLNRKAMKEVAPLRADEKYITHRVDMIREMENAATKAMKLPWSRVRAEVLNQIASLYLDLSKGLAALPPPKNLSSSDAQVYDETIRKLTIPFDEKGQDMRAKAFEIASKFSIENESFVAIAEPFFAENPSQAKALKPVEKLSFHEKSRLALPLLEQIDPSGNWEGIENRVAREGDKPEIYLKTMWAKALKSRHWAQVAFFMQEAHEKALMNSGAIGAVKAVSMAAAGAQGEGLAELEDAKGDLDPKARVFALSTLMEYSLNSFARDRTKGFLKEIGDESLNRDQAALVASAVAYTKGGVK